MVTDERERIAAEVAPVFGLTAAVAKQSPHALVGTVEEIVDDLVERRERFGINVIGLPLDAMDAFAPVVARLAGT
jgi:hypothetical protein